MQNKLKEQVVKWSEIFNCRFFRVFSLANIKINLHLNLNTLCCKYLCKLAFIRRPDENKLYIYKTQLEPEYLVTLYL